MCVEHPAFVQASFMSLSINIHNYMFLGTLNACGET